LEEELKLQRVEAQRMLQQQKEEIRQSGAHSQHGTTLGANEETLELSMDLAKVLATSSVNKAGLRAMNLAAAQQEASAHDVRLDLARVQQELEQIRFAPSGDHGDESGLRNRQELTMELDEVTAEIGEIWQIASPRNGDASLMGGSPRTVAARTELGELRHKMKEMQLRELDDSFLADASTHLTSEVDDFVSEIGELWKSASPRSSPNAHSFSLSSEDRAAAARTELRELKQEYFEMQAMLDAHPRKMVQSPRVHPDRISDGEEIPFGRMSSLGMDLTSLRGSIKERPRFPTAVDGSNLSVGTGDGALDLTSLRGSVWQPRENRRRTTVNFSGVRRSSARASFTDEYSDYEDDDDDDDDEDEDEDGEYYNIHSSSKKKRERDSINLWGAPGPGHEAARGREAFVATTSKSVVLDLSGTRNLRLSAMSPVLSREQVLSQAASRPRMSMQSALYSDEEF